MQEWFSLIAALVWEIVSGSVRLVTIGIPGRELSPMQELSPLLPWRRAGDSLISPVVRDIFSGYVSLVTIYIYPGGNQLRSAWDFSQSVFSPRAFSLEVIGGCHSLNDTTDARSAIYIIWLPPFTTDFRVFSRGRSKPAARCVVVSSWRW